MEVLLDALGGEGVEPAAALSRDADRAADLIRDHTAQLLISCAEDEPNRA